MKLRTTETFETFKNYTNTLEVKKIRIVHQLLIESIITNGITF